MCRCLLPAVDGILGRHGGLLKETIYNIITCTKLRPFALLQDPAQSPSLPVLPSTSSPLAVPGPSPELAPMSMEAVSGSVTAGHPDISTLNLSTKAPSG